VLLGGPALHVSPDLSDQLERGVGRDAVELRQIDAARQVMQRGANLESGFVVAGLLGDTGIGQRRRRRGKGSDERLDLRFDGAVAGGELGLTEIEGFQVLLECEEMLGPIVAGQRRDDLRL
jgi:hypothetical protein